MKGPPNMAVTETLEPAIDGGDMDTMAAKNGDHINTNRYEQED